MKFTLNSIFCFLSIIASHAYSLPNIRKSFKRQPIDKKIFELAKPATLNYVMVPVVGMIDTFWVSKLGTADQLAGVGSADQIFSIFYVLASFLPVIITPKITELHLLNKKKETSRLISLSLILTNIFGFIMTTILFLNSYSLLNFFVTKSPNIIFHANNYLQVRALGLFACLSNSLIFSIFRGFMDFKSAITINLQSQILNIILDPILMNYLGLQGVALASVISEVFCTFNYLILLNKNNFLTKKVKILTSQSFNLIKEGSFIQIKNIFNNLLYLYITRKILSLDSTGVSMASHVILIKFLELCSISYAGLYSVANIIIPSEKIQNNDVNTRNRLLFWTTIIGIIQGFIILNLSSILPIFTEDINIINTCKKLLGVISFYQFIHGHTYILEGILQGYQKFKDSGIGNILSAIPTFLFLYFAKINSLFSIWLLASLTLFLKSIYNHSIINFKIKDN